jgi:hypothetical protein
VVNIVSVCYLWHVYCPGCRVADGTYPINGTTIRPVGIKTVRQERRPSGLRLERISPNSGRHSILEGAILDSIAKEATRREPTPPKALLQSTLDEDESLYHGVLRKTERQGGREGKDSRRKGGCGLAPVGAWGGSLACLVGLGGSRSSLQVVTTCESVCWRCCFERLSSVFCSGQALLLAVDS